MSMLSLENERAKKKKEKRERESKKGSPPAVMTHAGALWRRERLNHVPIAYFIPE